jgi:hypothetical protein
MASFFESVFGLNTQETETNVPQLSISNAIPELEIKSQKYFTVKKDAKAANNDQLAVTINSDFNVNNRDHLDHLKACTDLFQTKAKALQALDQKIVFSAMLGMAASTLSFVPFVSYFSTLGWGSALYYATQRNTAALEYQATLNLLVATCNWSLGIAPNGQSEQHALINNDEIREMMAALYPVLTNQQAAHLIADDIEKAFLAELSAYENRFLQSSNPNGLFTPKDESIAHSKRSAEFYRCIYGYQKGKATDYLGAFLAVIPDISNALTHGFERFQHWLKSGAPTTQNDQTQATL